MFYDVYKKVSVRVLVRTLRCAIVQSDVMHGTTILRHTRPSQASMKGYGSVRPVWCGVTQCSQNYT